MLVCWRVVKLESFPSIGEYKIHVEPPAGLVLEDPSKDLCILILCTFGKLTAEGT